MVKLKRAIRRTEGLMAECREDGICQCRIITKGKTEFIPCGYFAGTHEDERGLHVRCNHPLNNY